MLTKQVLDWAFFVRKHGKDVDWDWLFDILKEYGMLSFFQIMNDICVEDLGFEATYFPKTHCNPLPKDRVLHEILEPKITNAIPQRILKRVVWKIRRWKANEWKHKLCYKEGRWSAFWSGVWAHMLKPSSI